VSSIIIILQSTQQIPKYQVMNIYVRRRLPPYGNIAQIKIYFIFGKQMDQINIFCMDNIILS
jgi:hypothetical protein